MYDSAYLVKEMTTSRSIQKDGVAMAADVGSLAEKAHVLVESKATYNETLNKTDIMTGSNSFYTIHLLQSDDDGSGEQIHWVSHQWGRIGVSQGDTNDNDGTMKRRLLLR